MAAGWTEVEAAARSALVDVESYEVFLDLVSDPDEVRSRTEIRFSCAVPGAATFADISASTVSQVVLNGESLDPGAVVLDGRLRLDGLAVRNVLTVDAAFPYSVSGGGLARFVDRADGSAYVLGNCFPPRLQASSVASTSLICARTSR